VGIKMGGKRGIMSEKGEIIGGKVVKTSSAPTTTFHPNTNKLRNNEGKG
jgi:hypothetical protein